MILIDRIVTLRCRSPCGERGLKWHNHAVAIDCFRRSPCGERGLKCQAAARQLRHIRRSPCGERGLKFFRLHLLLVGVESLPVRGAWFEIVGVLTVNPKTQRRSPCGERGLKYFWRLAGSPCDVSSLPVRGAWIEMIRRRRSRRKRKRSLPVRGAWIEISSPRLMMSSISVAPRAGSVD